MTWIVERISKFVLVWKRFIEPLEAEKNARRKQRQWHDKQGNEKNK